MSDNLSVSLYDGTIRTLRSIMESLENLLKKAAEQDNGKNLLSARLAEDMKPLSFQVHAATRFCDLTICTLVRQETTPYEDDIKTYDDAEKRIKKIIALIDSKPWKDLVNEKGTLVETTVVPSAGTMDLAGWQFAYGGAMPNIFFHLNMAYAILRSNGVPLSKSDYITGFVEEFMMKKD